MKHVITILLSLVCPLLYASPQLYTVHDVEVVLQNSSNYAQNPFAVAVRQGQKTAFNKLILRLSSIAEHDQIPPISANELGKLVSKVDLQSEHKSPAEYRVKLTYFFYPNRVKEFLAGKNLAIAETKHKPIIILPLLKENENIYLWEENNIWRDAWLTYPKKEAGLVPLKLPYGDLKDMGTLSALQALSGDVERVKQLAKRYNTDNVLVVLASQEKRDDGTSGLQFSTHYYGDTTLPNLLLNEISDDNNNKPNLLSYVEKIVALIEDSWKQKMVPDQTQNLEYEVKIALDSPSSLNAFESRLNHIPFIKKRVILSMTSQEAFLKLKVNTSEEQFKQALDQQNLVLNKEENGYELVWKENYSPTMGT
jgi:uncharacterized protein DUF2066